MAEQDLFYEFDSISSEAWKDKILQDLKGKDYEKTLVWRTVENIKVQPFYAEHEQKNISSFRKSATWKIVAPIVISNSAQQEALENLTGGATQIHFIGDNTTFDIDKITQGIQLDLAPISFQNVQWQDSHINFWTTNKHHNGHLGIDPLARLHKGDSKSYDKSDITKWIKIRKDIKAQWGVLAIDGSVYKNSGGHFVDEIAFILAALQENLHQLRKEGIPSNDIGTIQIRTAIGPNFFFEIAKIKVIRHLTQLVAQQYEGADIEILAESSDLYHSHLDTETNILRLTTEGMSGILGGAEGVMLHPYDIKRSNVAQKISRNIQHLLIEESFFEKQIDPIEGSYYIEQLFHDLKTPSWNVFLSIEEHQGYIKSFVGKTIPQFYIFRHKTALLKDISKRKVVVLGANQFPNLKDNLGRLNTAENTTLDSTILQPFRLSEPFERIRIRLQNHIDTTGEFPQAFLWQYGEKSMRNARASFAFNFLATAGISSIENSQPDNWEQSVKEMKEFKIVVLCSDNASWEEFLPKSADVITDDQLIILAGKNNEYHGLKIYAGCNLLPILEEVFNQIGIK